MDLSQILTIVLTAIATGFGTAIGSYIATAHLIQKIKQAKEIINGNNSKKV